MVEILCHFLWGVYVVLEAYAFERLDKVEGSGELSRLEELSGVTVRAELVVGGVELELGSVLEWRVGDVVDLEDMYGDSMELRVNGKNVGRGELVVLDDGSLGIRIVKLGK